MTLWHRVDANFKHYFSLGTVPLRRKPDYLIIGAQKCGTTTLFNMLSLHPQVRNPRNKEMHFFDGRDIQTLGHYRAKFPLWSRKITGEATPVYVYYPGVADRVFEQFPQCRIIVLLRNPIDRAYSHYRMRFRRGKEVLSFEEAISAEGQRLTEAREQGKHSVVAHNAGLLAHSYLDRGLYAQQLEHWFERYGRHQIHVVCYERFAQQPKAEFDRVCDFLGLERSDEVKPLHLNSGDYESMAAATRRELNAYFEAPNSRLFDLLGEDFGWNDAAE